MPSPVKLGRRIRQLRLDRNLSQEELAAPDYTAAYISHIEHGKRRPSREALEHITDKLGLSIEQLLTGRDPDEDLRQEIAVLQAVDQIHQGQASGALSALEEVCKAAEGAGNQRVAHMAHTGLGLALFRLGKLHDALAAYEQALEAMRDAHAEMRTSALVGKARCLFHLGDAREAVYLLETHLFDLQRSDPPDPGCLVETFAALIPPYYESGSIERAVEAADRGWRLVGQVEDVEQRACLYVNRANLFVTRGQRREALASLALAEDLYRSAGWKSEMVKVSLARSHVLTEEGQFDEAERLIREALDNSAVVSKVDEVRALTRLALIRRLAGDPQAGITIAQDALKRIGKGPKGSAAEALREVGLCHRALGEEADAITAWRRSIEWFKDADDHEELARTAQLLGDALVEFGDTAAALEIYRKGLASVERIR